MEDKIISVSENGFISIWRLGLNETNSVTNLFDKKTQISCISTNPYATWMSAFGTESGHVIIADLRSKYITY